MDSPHGTAFLRSRLIETIAWCLPRADKNDPARCLRTPALQPPNLAAPRDMVMRSTDLQLNQTHPLSGDLRGPRMEERRVQRSHAFQHLYSLQEPHVESVRQLLFSGWTDQRAALVCASPSYPDVAEQDTLVPHLAGGRLLVCTGLDESVLDGAAQAESQGFFDEHDLAPWDTWL